VVLACDPTMARIGQAMSEGGQRRRRYLVEQRLEAVVVLSVDECQLDVGVAKSLHDLDSREAPADHDHTRPAASAFGRPG
jgi:hypothetical protein